jgi:hypothetical protein
VPQKKNRKAGAKEWILEKITKIFKIRLTIFSSRVNL